MITAKRSLGIHFCKGKCRVLIWAPFSNAVILRNLTTGEAFSLEAQPLGYWGLTTEKMKPGDRYMFSLDDGNPLPDPASLSQPSGVHGPSEAIDLNDYQWQDHEWENRPFNEYVIYELHTGTFTDEGTFEAVTGKLDYLKELGINAIELMPVAQFPGQRNWGYDGVFPYAVQDSYGGARKLQALVDACHAKGIAVILDVVYNHLGPEGNYLPAYGPYFTDKYKTPWGAAINFDDAYCDPVRQFYIENALMWLRDFHIDALRLDAVHAIKDFSPKHIIEEMNEAVMLLNKEITTAKYLIAETDLNDTRFIRPKTTGGFGLTAQWCDEFHHALRVCAGQERTGYYTDFNGIEDFAKSLKDAYVYTGQYSAERHRTFGTDTTGITPDHFVVFDQNHDQVGNRMMGERLSLLVSFEMQKLMAAAFLTSPFIPLLFMGEEWGATSPFLYFTDHSDKALIEAIDKGRKEEFRHFAGFDDPPPAHALDTFLQSKPDWQEQIRNKYHFQYYQYLLRLRNQLNAVPGFANAIRTVTTEQQKDILVFVRTTEKCTVISMFNFSKEAQELAIGGNVAAMKVLLHSAAKQWGGIAEEINIASGGAIKLQPESVLILSDVSL